MKQPPRPRPRPGRPGLGTDGEELLASVVGPESADHPCPADTSEPERVTLLDRVRADRAAARRHHRRQQMLIAAGVAALCALLGWVVFFSPLFALRTVKVEESTGQISPPVIQAVVQPYLGTPLPRLSTSDIETAVESLSVVKDARVQRSWPREVIVTVIPREPVAAIDTGQGTFDLYDDTGTLISSTSDKPAELPLLSGAGGQQVQPELIPEVLSTLACLDAPVRSQLTRASIDAEGLMTFTLDSGALIVWGPNTDNELKSRVLTVLLGQTAKIYDVSSPRTPVTR